MICLEAPSRVNPRVVTAACVTNATRYRALQRFLLSERNALTLWRHGLDRDALASNGCTKICSQVSGCIPYLAVGDSDKLILPDEAELGSHRLRARKSSYWIKQVLNGGKSEFMTFDVRPGSVLRAAERVLRSNLMNAPLRGEVS